MRPRELTLVAVLACIGATACTTGGGQGGPATGGISALNCRPDILIVQDKSGSMNNDDNDQSCGGGCAANSKWAQVSAAISNVVEATDGRVNWGIKYFPDNGACDASVAPAVGIATSNGFAVADSIAWTTPGGNTPTRDAITFGAAYLANLTDSNPKYLVLATDGLPNCPAGCAAMPLPVPQACTLTDNPDEDSAAEAAVMLAASQGFNTFVIGIGNVATGQSTLNQLALAGGEGRTGATAYYVAGDEPAFEAALNTIVGSIPGCSGP